MSGGRRWIGVVATLAAVAAIAAGSLAETAPTATSKGWIVRRDGDLTAIESPHYRVRTDMGLEAADLIATQQEALFNSLNLRMGGFKPAVGTLARMDIIVAKTQERVSEVQAKDAKGAPGTMYSPSPISLGELATTSDLDMLFTVLRQDGTRQITVLYLGGKCPVWVHEGLVALFRNGHARDGQIVTGQVPAAPLAALKQALADKKFVPLDDFVNMPPEEWAATIKVKGTGAAILFHESWIVAHFLDSADGGKYRPSFTQYMALVSHGTPPAQAWERSFGATPAAIDKRLRDYIAALKPTEGLGCRANLVLLGMLVAKSGGAPKDIKALQEFALNGGMADMSSTTGDGIKLEFKDQDLAKLVFRCPDDFSKADVPSYELIPAADGGLMTVRCRHHPGVVVETSYVKNDNTLTVNVAARPASAAAATVPAKTGTVPAKTGTTPPKVIVIPSGATKP
jgi:hypothetical protein